MTDTRHEIAHSPIRRGKAMARVLTVVLVGGVDGGCARTEVGQVAFSCAHAVRERITTEGEAIHAARRIWHCIRDVIPS
ncbi:MAG: hypothetical protein R3E77_10360 [Steroidobacteraceae bacterium]